VSTEKIKDALFWFNRPLFKSLTTGKSLGHFIKPEKHCKTAMQCMETVEKIYEWCEGNISSKSQCMGFCVEVRDLIDREVHGFSKEPQNVEEKKL